MNYNFIGFKSKQQRRFLLKTALMGMLSCAAWLANAANDEAANYPERSIRFIVPYAAGGFPDVVARIVAKHAGSELGKSIVVENKPGGNGGPAATALLSSPRDGYTFLATDGAMMSISPQLYSNLTYDAKKDFQPVAVVAQAPLFLATGTKTGLNTFQDLVDKAKANPGQLNFGSSGVGSSTQLVVEILKSDLGLNIQHVPYRGMGDAAPALVSGQIDILFSSYPPLAAFVKKGDVKFLATSALKRSKLTPDIPAVSEFIPDFDYANTVGVLAATGVPQYAIDKLANAISKAVNMPEVKAQLEDLALVPLGEGPEAYRKNIDAEIERQTKAIKAAGLSELN